jgi:hypothetical protein
MPGVVAHQRMGQAERLVVHPGVILAYKFSESLQGVAGWPTLFGALPDQAVDAIELSLPLAAGGLVYLRELLVQPLVARDGRIRSPLDVDAVGLVDGLE